MYMAGASSSLLADLLLVPSHIHTFYIPYQGGELDIACTKHNFWVRVPCPRIALGFVLDSTVLTGQTNKEEVFAEIDANCSKIGGSGTTLDTW